MVPARHGYAAGMESRPAKPRSAKPAPTTDPAAKAAASQARAPSAPPAAAPRRPNDPLDQIERLLVDGTNLLHAIRRGAAPAPAATLIGRLRGVIEMPIRIELVFDGPPDPGLRDARIASGLVGPLQRPPVGGRAARPARGRGSPSRGHCSSSRDDIELRHELTRRGGRTAGTRWLIGRLSSGAPGRHRRSAARSRHPRGGQASSGLPDMSSDGTSATVGRRGSRVAARRRRTATPRQPRTARQGPRR